MSQCQTDKKYSKSNPNQHSFPNSFIISRSCNSIKAFTISGNGIFSIPSSSKSAHHTIMTCERRTLMIIVNRTIQGNNGLYVRGIQKWNDDVRLTAPWLYILNDNNNQRVC